MAGALGLVYVGVGVTWGFGAVIYGAPPVPGIPPLPIMPAAIFCILAIYSGDMFCIIWLAWRIMAGSMLAIIGL